MVVQIHNTYILTKTVCWTMTQMQTEEIYYWHIHHDTLMEKATEPIQNRIDYIKNHKPKDEISTRIRLLKPVKNQSKAKAYYDAIAQSDKAYHDAIAQSKKAYHDAIAQSKKAYDDAIAPSKKAYYDAIAPSNKAYHDAIAQSDKAYDDAIAQSDKALESLHKKECHDCPWNGKTIFPQIHKTYILTKRVCWTMTQTANGKSETKGIDSCIDEDGRVWYWTDDEGWV